MRLWPDYKYSRDRIFSTGMPFNTLNTNTRYAAHIYVRTRRPGISYICDCKSYNCECPREFQYAPEKILHPIEIRSTVRGGGEGGGEGCRVWRWKVTRMLLPPWIAKGRLRFPTRRKCSPAVRSSRHAFCSSNLFYFLYRNAMRNLIERHERNTI